MVDVNSFGRRNATRWIAGGVIAGLMLALLAWIYLSNVELVGPPSALRDDEGGSKTIFAPVVAGAQLTNESPRALVDVAPAPERASAATTPPDTAAPNELRGRVIDSADRLVSGARVGLHRGEVRDYFVPDHGLSHATEAMAELTTDASGEFRFELECGIPVDLHAEAADFCPALIPNCRAGEFVVVRLSAGYRVFGRVTRARDGAPVAEADVRLFQSGGPESLRRETRTAGDGSFELRFAFRDRPMLDIVPQLEQSPGWVEFTLDANGEAEQNVVVKDGFIVLGKVSAAGTGQPIAGAMVAEDFVLRHAALTDENGEYRLTGFGDSRGAELFAKAAWFGTVRRQNLPGAIDGVLHVDFQLKPSRSAHGRVVDASGAPLRDVLCVAIAREFGAQGERLEWISSHTDTSGRFNIENLSSDLRHTLLLSKYGCATRVYDFPKEELTTLDLDLGSFALGAPALLAGVVEDESGQGLAETKVTLTGNNADRFRMVGENVAGERRVSDFYTATRTSSSDAQGRFSFGGLAAGTYSLLARRSGRPESKPVSVNIAEAELKDDVKLLMPSGARLFGRVADPEGRAVDGVSVSAKPLKPPEPGSRPERDTGAHTDAEGKFEILGLSPGDYRVSARPLAKASSDPDDPLMPVSVDQVSANSSELKITLPRGATIRGSLHDKSGAAVFGYLVVVPNKVDGGLFITTDANGEFCVAVERESVNELEIHGPLEGGLMNKVFLVERAVAAGTRGLNLILP